MKIRVDADKEVVAKNVGDWLLSEEGQQVLKGNIETAEKICAELKKRSKLTDADMKQRIDI
jgi:hypothetical protein